MNSQMQILNETLMSSFNMKVTFVEPIGLSSQELDEIKDKYETSGNEIVIYKDRKEDEETLIERAKDADIMIVSNIKISRNVLEKCTNLKMISVAFTGVDHIDMDYCREHDIVVCNAAGFSNDSVAELTINMILSVYRNTVKADAITRNGGDMKGFLGTELSGKTIGIIGCGKIGTRVAQICQAFNCKVLAYNRNPKDIHGVKFTSKEELLKQSDIISLHTPLTDESRNIIGKEEFELMKESAILINTARGPVVNSQDLFDALNSGKIAGAATDVYDCEPPLKEDNILLKAPNLIMLPHIAYATKEAFKKRASIVCENIHYWLAECPRNLIE